LKLPFSPGAAAPPPIVFQKQQLSISYIGFKHLNGAVAKNLVFYTWSMLIWENQTASKKCRNS
jgi:hypothetical protein